MRLSRRIDNIIVDIDNFGRRHVLVLIPVTCLIIVVLLSGRFELSSHNISNIVNVSGVLAGFLFSVHSIMLSFPDEKNFVQHLKKSGYIKIIFRCIFTGEMFLFATLLIGIFIPNKNLLLFTFLSGLICAIVSAIYLYRISIMVSNSK
ncbi:hypothetical protein SAMN05192546_11141 [Tindallia californiensis]|uniref:Uncharacterized protein n=1 Tax=Tindallia californiensis TaxID=159292 RepID=A0A1H3QZA9_9FIRM|nr:hypothetical protein SAMN05192546_11141 [Tindallia californiensis]